ncbi:MAG: hypothetical protein KJ970_02225 [Candidatus Eisenbacteria bacterium]|uniref:Uncharacterized protein n=1 Tax=Eiseniibacteriota bacterium TaxID=2212470 RepID=A0A948RU25_UNCEI|nr:hypothetical protein [Candidatus Eisenbacteria bacterium]MBU1950802.1 hypothetical protein [Candidatus Eisenbacteria bacterium]MBU2689714.1 hypothetical protein [Candidatus Eisenbacteria bacterium]
MKYRRFWILGILAIFISMALPLPTQGWTTELPHSKEGGSPDIYHGPDDPQGDGDADDLSIYATHLGPRIEVGPYDGGGYDPKVPSDGLQEKSKKVGKDLRTTLRLIFVQTLARLWIR